MAPRLASARAGNVIGGGDWASDRLIPDVMRARARGRADSRPQPDAIRPWQHVLDPLSGYLVLAQALVRGARASPAAGTSARRRTTRSRCAGSSTGSPSCWPGDLRWVDRRGPAPARGALPEARLDEGARAARLGAGAGTSTRRSTRSSTGTRRSATARTCARVDARADRRTSRSATPLARR